MQILATAAETGEKINAEIISSKHVPGGIPGVMIINRNTAKNVPNIPKEVIIRELKKG